MHKTLLAIIFLLAVMFIPAYFTYAEDSVIETPDVKIIIDGKITTYNDVPLSVNQRTMLPLRELLVNLGVPNDVEHIVWNNDEKSVTIYKDSTKIYLKQESMVAYVNDNPVTLDVPVIGYSKNQRTYIPVRFVSECLGKKVVWDGSAKAVLIRDAEEFDSIREILSKSDAAMESVNKCKFTFGLNADTSGESLSFNIEASCAGEVDKAKNAMHMLLDISMLGMGMKMEKYFCDGVYYSKNPFTGTWEKEILSPLEFDRMFEQNQNTDILKVKDTLSAGLVVAETEDPNEIMLKGDVYLGELYNMAQTTSGNNTIIRDNSNTEIERFYVEISINKNTYLINRINMNIKGTSYYEHDKFNMNMDFSVIYSDYEGDFKITVPQDVLENAVEVVNRVESEH